MQTTFWKEGIVKIVVLALLPLCPISMIIAGLILSFNDNGYWVLLGAGVLLLFMCLVPLLSRDTFTKVLLSNSGITLKSRNTNQHIDWCDVTDVKTTYSGYTIRYLTIITGETAINIFLNLDLYNAIMELCSNTAIKNQINALPEINSRLKNKKHKK